MYTLFSVPYFGYIDIAKVDGKLYLCTHSARLKGIDDGY